MFFYVNIIMLPFSPGALGSTLDKAGKNAESWVFLGTTLCQKH